MLEIYDADLTKADIVDINAEFSKTLIAVDDNMKRIVKAIDQGELIDSNKFKDRFGVSLYVSELSTGCNMRLLSSGIDCRYTGMWSERKRCNI